MFGSVLFTGAALIGRASTIDAQVIGSSVNGFCVQARADAADLRSSGMPDNYGPALVEACGEFD